MFLFPVIGYCFLNLFYSWTVLPSSILYFDFFSQSLSSAFGCSPDLGLQNAVFSIVRLKDLLIGLWSLCILDGFVYQESKVLVIGQSVGRC